MFYIVKNEELKLFDDDKQRLTDTLLFMPDLKEERILETDLSTAKELRKYPYKLIIGDIEIEIDVPDYEITIDEDGTEVKTPKYKEIEETVLVPVYDEDGNQTGEEEKTVTKTIPLTHKETITVKGLVLNPAYLDKRLNDKKEILYKEAYEKAKDFIATKALYEIDKDTHIEATDENLAKIGLKTLALAAAQDTETTFTWNTKEDKNIELNLASAKEVSEGIEEVQTQIWTVQYPNYLETIKNSMDIQFLDNLIIEYAQVTEADLI